MRRTYTQLRSGIRSHLNMIVAGILSAGTVVVLALVVMFWEWLSDGESGSTTVRNVALVLAGVVALPLAIWRSMVADRQAKTAQQSLLNERYQKGAEMLGSDVLSVRLAGIYALRRLAAEHLQQYHIQVMRLFCAFVRLPTRDQSLEFGQAPIQPGTLLGIRQDVESVMEAIGYRTETQKAVEREEDFRLDLRGADLSETQILNADLSRAMFHHSNLCSVNFANTDLTDAFFSYADLSKARFYDVNFTGTVLQFANLTGAMLQDAEMVRQSLHNVSLSDANLGRANLSESILQDAKVDSAWLDGATLTNATFLRADLCRSRLVRADLTGAEFLDANLTGARIDEANLSDVRFSHGGQQPAKGLTQAQLDQARADPDRPPNLLNVLNAETGEQLVWRGRPLGYQVKTS